MPAWRYSQDYDILNPELGQAVGGKIIKMRMEVKVLWAKRHLYRLESSGLESRQRMREKNQPWVPACTLLIADQCPGDKCYSILPAVSRILTMAFGP